MSQKEIDHEYTDNIVCPYCGSEETDSHEYEDDYSEDITCGDCGKNFGYERHRNIDYSTFKIN